MVMKFINRIKLAITDTPVIEVIANIFYYGAPNFVNKRFIDNSIYILLYHEVIRENFEDIIELKDKGFSFITYEQMVNCLSSNKMPPPRSIVITFDDGLRSIFTEAYPVIMKEHIPIMVFLISNFLFRIDTSVPNNGRSYLSLDETKELYKTGLVAFGSHTMSHPCLTDISLINASAEIVNSKKRLEQELGFEIKHFSYPYGGPSTYSKNHIRVLSESGYKSAVTNIAGVNSLKTSIYELKRVRVHEKQSVKSIQLLMSGVLHKLIGSWKGD